jgi:acetyltransferase-like isoleucine patch superfamily enzyme
VLFGDRSGEGLIKRTVGRSVELVAARVLEVVRPELERRIAEARAAASADAEAAVIAGRLHKPVIFGQADRVHVADTAVVNDALFNTMSGSVTIEPDAFTGHGVALLTGTHDVGERGLARQQAVPTEGRDIVIETGAWVASRAVVLGPCRVGAHAVVAAGAVVTEDVPPGAIVAGVPARVVGWALPTDDS